MGKRLNRTVKNWRWWILLPLYPFMMAAITVQLILHMAHIVVEHGTEQFPRLLNWMRNGATP